MTTYYSNGKKSSEVFFEKNEMEGSYIEYYENEKIKTKGTYVHSIEEGLWISTYENEKTYESGKYIKGKREGVWTQITEDGKTTVKLKYKTGILISGTPIERKVLPAVTPNTPAAPAQLKPVTTPKINKDSEFEKKPAPRN